MTTADQQIRAGLPGGDNAVRATVGSVSCAVHAKGKTALEVAVEIARAAAVDLPGAPADLMPAVRDRLARRPARFALVIDALDERPPPVRRGRSSTTSCYRWPGSAAGTASGWSSAPGAATTGVT